MSSTLRGAKREDHDQYYTPTWCVQRLIEDPDLPFSPQGKYLEPSAGDGNIIRALSQPQIDWTACEIRPECQPNLDPICSRVLIGDATRILRSHLKGQRFDVAITNPPFSLAERLWLECMRISKVTCFLLRLNYLASSERATMLQTYSPDVFVLPNRPDFTGGGGDSIEYAWFVWTQKPRSKGTIKILKKTPAHKRITSP